MSKKNNTHKNKKVVIFDKALPSTKKILNNFIIRLLCYLFISFAFISLEKNFNTIIRDKTTTTKKKTQIFRPILYPI